DVIGGQSLTLLKGQGDGTFQNRGSIGARPPRSVVTGDVNADGKLDLVVSTQETRYAFYGPYGGYYPSTTGYTDVLLGYGDGTFAQPVTTAGGHNAGFGTTNASTLGDFNEDGRPDLAATDPNTGTIFVQINQGNWMLPGALT